MQDIKQKFEDSTVELCKTLSPGKVKQLDSILSQDKPEIELFEDLLTQFPQFKDIFVSKLNQ